MEGQTVVSVLENIFDRYLSRERAKADTHLDKKAQQMSYTKGVKWNGKSALTLVFASFFWKFKLNILHQRSKFSLVCIFPEKESSSSPRIKEEASSSVAQ